MLKGLHAWMHDLPLPHISPKRTPIHSTVREAYYVQNDLGWDNLLHGRLHRSSESAQSTYQASREQAISPDDAWINQIIMGSGGEDVEGS